LAGVARLGEHGLAKKEAAKVHAVQAPHQAAVHPGFNTMNLPERMPLTVGADDSLRYPRTRLSGAGRCTGPYHVFKCQIGRNDNLWCSAVFIARDLPELFTE